MDMACNCEPHSTSAVYGSDVFMKTIHWDFDTNAGFLQFRRTPVLPRLRLFTATPSQIKESPSTLKSYGWATRNHSSGLLPLQVSVIKRSGLPNCNGFAFSWKYQWSMRISISNWRPPSPTTITSMVLGTTWPGIWDWGSFKRLLRELTLCVCCVCLIGEWVFVVLWKSSDVHNVEFRHGPTA